MILVWIQIDWLQMSWGKKGYSDVSDALSGWTGRVSHQLGSFLGAFDGNCFVCIWMQSRMFDAQIRETLYKWGF